MGAGPHLVGQFVSGQLSSVEETERYLARIEALDGEIRSYVTVTAELARERAAAADATAARGDSLGPLHGVPVALKDNIDTAGVRTTAGSAFFADRVPDTDAPVAARLRAAGAVLLGKLQLHEFAFGATTQNPHHGLCRNPWDTTRIPGGSSGGSGAAVAADLCALALGTDTGGSVRIPSFLNGISGLRPTIGRVPNTAVFPVSWSFDTVGPMARTVVDVADMFAVIAGYDASDPSSVDVPVESPTARLHDGVDGVRIGLPRSFSIDVDPEILAGMRAVADVLASLGANVTEIDIEGEADAVVACATMIRGDVLAVHRERLDTEPERFGEDVRRRLEATREITGADYAQAREAGRRWTRYLHGVLADVDAILAPVAGIVAPDAGSEMIETTRLLTQLTYGTSLAGLPALAIPAGLAHGLPFGVQLTGRPWEEALLLRIGAAYQTATDWHTLRPPLAVERVGA